jgi:hypothetical protein
VAKDVLNLFDADVNRFFLKKANKSPELQKANYEHVAALRLSSPV